MKKNNGSNNKVNEKSELSFVEKYKTDKKYKAKVELIGYGIFIIGLIIYSVDMYLIKKVSKYYY